MIWVRLISAPLSDTPTQLTRPNFAWANTDLDGPLRINATNIGGDFTGGDAGNSLRITVLYTLIAV